MFQRILASELTEEIRSHGKSVLVLGPRQVGKSTLLASLQPHLTINLALESAFRAHLKDPELIERMVAAVPPTATILIDEVQRIPSILNSVQALIDQRRDLRFLLSGSSARKLRKDGTNLLPGRLFAHQLFPLTFWELGDAFDLEKCLLRGCLPEVYSADYGTRLLNDYIDIYLREEVLAEGLVRNMASFGSLLDVIARLSGLELNYAQVSSDAEIPKESLRRYIDILEDTLIVYRLPGFTQIKGKRKAVQREKLLLFDMGVRNGILGLQNNTLDDQSAGALFEQWLILQVFAFAAYKKKRWSLYYYRDDLRQEIDLIIETPTRLSAIEIKWAKSFKREWTRHLRAFDQTSLRPTTCFVLYRGDVEQSESDIRVLPYTRFLSQLEAYVEGAVH